MIHKEFVPEGKQVNSEFYVFVLKRLLERISCLRPKFWWNGSGSFCTTYLATALLARRGVAEISHPPYNYSPDLAPAEIFVPESEKHRPKNKISGHLGCQEDVTTKWNAVPLDAFRDCFVQLSEIRRKCIAVNGDYAQGKENNFLLFSCVSVFNYRPRKFIVWPRTDQENKRITVQKTEY
jgi:hypothetical protein